MSLLAHNLPRDWLGIIPSSDIVEPHAAAMPDASANEPARALWLAVLARAIRDALSGPDRERSEARAFLFGTTPEWRDSFALVAAAAGFDAAWLRQRLVARLDDPAPCL